MLEYARVRLNMLEYARVHTRAYPRILAHTHRDHNLHSHFPAAVGGGANFLYGVTNPTRAVYRQLMRDHELLSSLRFRRYAVATLLLLHGKEKEKEKER